MKTLKNLCSTKAKSLIYLVALSIVLFAFPISIDAQSDVLDQQKVDSLQNLISQAEGEKKIKLYKELSLLIGWVGDNELVIKTMKDFIREAEAQQDIAATAYAHSYNLSFLSVRDDKEAIEESFHKALEFTKKHELWNDYFFMYLAVLPFYYNNYETEHVLNLVQTMYDEGKKYDYSHGMGMATVWLGNLAKDRSLVDESEMYYLEAIDRLTKPEVNWRVIDAYYNLALLYIINDKLDDAETIINDWQSVYDNTTKKNINVLDLNKLESTRSALYIRQGDIENAEKSIKKQEEYFPYLPVTEQISQYATQLEFYSTIGEYDAALEAINKLLEMAKETNNTYFMVNGEYERSKILAALGRYKEALDSYMTYHQEVDSLNTIESTANFNEMRTKYEVDKLTAEKEIQRQRVIIGIVASSLLLIVLIIYIIYSRRLAKKNQALYEQVKELSRKEKAVEQCLLARPDEFLSKPLQLFKKISEYMQKEKAFVNPDLSRKTLADTIGTNEMYLADAIKAGTGETYSNYLANLRLQYALELLIDRPDLTLDAIADESGHGSYSQFFRSFSKKYGISPSEYRKLAAKK